MSRQSASPTMQVLAVRRWPPSASRRLRPRRRTAALRCRHTSGRGLNKVLEQNAGPKTNGAGQPERSLSAAGAGGTSGAVAGADVPRALGRANHLCGLGGVSQPPQPALFAWVTCGGKNLTPVRRCGLGGPHPGTSAEWRRLCQSVSHSGISKHAEMAAIAALQPEALRAPRKRRLTLVVVRLRTVARNDTEDGILDTELGLARPCDECAKVIWALGRFRRVVYSEESGRLVSVAPDELLLRCQPSSGKRLQQKHREEAQNRLSPVQAATCGGSSGQRNSQGRRTRGS
mmetsp:Transcript_37638/g.82620  ORF Transcript_37638/g.82620 Transcript_37638/m.82620 type:complete len:288 (-) Transcript_37638:55-918(-)